MENKKKAPTTIDEFIAGYPPEVQAVLQEIRRVIRSEAPEARETINYGIPTFTLNGNLVHFSAFEHHIGFYPTPGGIEKFKEELSAYKGAKGSVQFPLDRPMPYDLIRRITAFRVQENIAKAQPKKKK